MSNEEARLVGSLVGLFIGVAMTWSLLWMRKVFQRLDWGANVGATPTQLVALRVVKRLMPVVLCMCIFGVAISVISLGVLLFSRMAG